MNARNIREVVSSFNNAPYDCILINGKWGIGKTYEILEGKKHHKHCKIISLFGLRDSSELFKRLFWQLLGDVNEINKGVESVLSFGKGIAACFGVDKIVDSIIGAIPNEKELVERYLKGIDTPHILIFDDIERISPDFNLHDFLGIVESLSQFDNLKIILVANLNEFTDGQQIIYDKYHEKIIDKVYTIDSFSKEIKWSDFGIEETFIIPFIDKHGLDNLRTLKKAQQFYQDVVANIGVEVTSVLHDALLNLCYAIVVETIDEKYFKTIQNEIANGKDAARYRFAIENFTYRIQCYYLYGTNYDKNLVEEVYKYYKTSQPMDKQIIENSQTVLKQWGKKPNYYKSDDELKIVIEQTLSEFDKSTTVAEAINKADTVLCLMEILDEETEGFVHSVKEKIWDLIKNEIKCSGETSFNMFSPHVDSEHLQKILKGISSELPKYLIDNCIVQILHNLRLQKYRCCNDYLEILRNCISRNEKESIVAAVKKLLVDEILPLKNIEDEQWRFVRNLCGLLKVYIPDQLKTFVDSSKEKHSDDKIFLHRINSIETGILN